jgi:hypothetical protein
VEKQKITERIRDIREKNLDFWQQYWDAMTEEEAFVDGDRYEQDNSAYNRDRRRTQIRGQEIFDTIRHVGARLTERPRSVEARPVDNEEDAEMAETAVSLVEWELGNEWKEFDDCLDEAILSAAEKRLGVVWMDWVPDMGPFGEIVYRFDDPRNYMWDHAYRPHHPLCGWLMQRRRVPIEWVRQNYPKATWVKPDREMKSKTSDSDEPILRGLRESPLNQNFPEDDRVTLWLTWFKNDKTEGKKVDGEFDELKPNERFMQCVSCGFKSESQEKLRDDGDFSNDFPEVLEDGCPICAGNLHRIDAKAMDKVTRAFKAGRRLVIMAPFSPGPEDEPVFDGSWPIPTARSFPGLFITSYVKPGRPLGPSETYLSWDQQIAADNLRTMALQRVFEHRTYWEMPEAGIHDRFGKRFMFREDQFNVMFRDGSQAFQTEVRPHSGAGLDPNFSEVFNITQQALTQNRPKLDLGLTQESSKNIPVGTVAQLEREASIPIEHMRRRKNRELGKFYSVLWDYIRATYTPERLARLRLEGIDLIEGLHGDDLPNFDFSIQDTPVFSGSDKAKSDAAAALVQIAINPEMSPYLEVFADVNEFPKSIVRKVTKVRDQQQALMQQQAQQMEQEDDMILEDMASQNGGEIPPEMLAELAPGAGPGAEQGENL